MRIRLACAAGLLLSVPTIVLALGLGPLHTNSSLNEPFEAKIPLVDVKVEDLDTLKVGLANRTQFKRAGLEYALTLSDLRFDLVQPKAGDDYVRIWSKEDVREPVLDFLLEVNWSNGRLIREVTVLLDPPRYGSPPSSGALDRQATTVSPWPLPKPSPRADTTPGYTPEDHYGPTQAGDTLWGIARGTRSGEVSIQQMMVALLQANPNAFIDANINRLKQGQILRIPDAAALSSPTQAQALAEVRRHNALWEQYRQRLASSVRERSAGAQSSQGTVPDSERGGMQPPATEEARLELLSAAGSAVDKPQDGAAGRGGELGEGAGTETEQLVAEESEAVTQDEISHLRERLKESEALVELMRRQVQLKDDELAALQTKLAQAGTAAPAALEKPPAETFEEQPEGTPPAMGAEAGQEATGGLVATEPLAAAAAPAAPSSGESPGTAAPPGPQETAPSVGAQRLAPEPSNEAQQAAKTTVEATAPPVADSQEMVSTDEAQPAQAPSANVDLGGALGEVTPRSSETPQEGALRVDSVPIEGAPLIPGGTYSVVGLIAVAGMFAFWVFWRVRAKSQAPHDLRSGGYVTQRSGTIKEGTVEGLSPLAALSGFAGTEAEKEEGQIAERTLGDIQEHAYDVDVMIEEEAERTRPTGLAAEKDPLEEVYVCIAYERFDEAEQLIKKAIAVQPGRHDYQLRLLEVYYAAGNKSAYERAARELSTAVGGEGPLWDSAVAMWYEMSPERPLFSEQSGDGECQREGSQTEVLDITSLSDAGPWKSESSSQRAGLEMANALDFDLGTTQDDLAASTGAGAAPEEAGEYTDVFDLSSPEDAASEGIVDVTVVAEGTTDDGQIFDLTVAENTSGAEDVLDLTAVDSEQGVDQDMLDLTVADNAVNADGILELTPGLSSEDGALDFDITGGHQVPGTTEESEDALHLTVPKAVFASAKPPEPQEQVYEITHPRERSESGAPKIGQETVEVPNTSAFAEAAEQEDTGIQTVDLFYYFKKGDARGAGSGAEPDAPGSSTDGTVSEAAEASVSDRNNQAGDAPSDLGQSDAWTQTLADLDEEGRDTAENSGWDATEEETAEGEGDAPDVGSASEHRSQESSWQDGGFLQGEANQEHAPGGAQSDSTEWAQKDASEEIVEAQGAQGQSPASSEHAGSTPIEDGLEVENVEQTITMLHTVQRPRDSLALGTMTGGDSAAVVDNDFVVIEDLTVPEDVVIINLADDLDTGEILENERFAIR